MVHLQIKKSGPDPTGWYCKSREYRSNILVDEFSDGIHPILTETGRNLATLVAGYDHRIHFVELLAFPSRARSEPICFLEIFPETYKILLQESLTWVGNKAESVIATAQTYLSFILHSLFCRRT